MKFNEFNLTSDLMRGIEEAGFTECTPVQERTFKLVLEQGRDATVQSQTGTGKTAAFLISIFEIFERASREPEGGRRHAALIVVPTRELAVQVTDEAKLLGRHLSYRIGSVFGGVGYGQQERLLEKGADIIIGTPGRLLDFGSSRKLDFRGFDILVLDEADRMLDMGFLPDVRKILRAVPPVTERKTMLFSATLGTRVKNLAWEHMNNPGEIEVAPEHVTVDEITQELYHVTRSEKLRLLLGLLQRENPDNALIFTNMKTTAVELARRLSLNGLPSEYIMGDLPQRKRLQLIEGIKDGKIKLLVATDVAARGLHIDDLDLVVNYDVPEDYELYVHRIGRTARAGKTGKAITLACERYVFGLEAIESFIGQKIPVVWPDESLFKDDASARMSFSDRRGKGPGSRNGESRASGGQRSGARRRSGGGQGTNGGRRPNAESVPTRPGRERATTGNAGPHRVSETGDRRTGAGAVDANNGNSATSRNGTPRGPHKRTRQEPKPVASTAAKPSADASVEDRLSYYKQKYGEDFQFTAGRSGEPPAARKGGSKRPAGSGPARSEKKPPAQKGDHPIRKGNAAGPPKAAKSNGARPPSTPAPQKDTGREKAAPPASGDTGLVGKLKRLFKKR